MRNKFGLYQKAGFALFLAMMSGSAIAATGAKDLSAVASTGATNVFSIMGLLFAVSAVAGFFLCINGILLLKKDRNQPNQGHAGNGVVYLLSGVGLLGIVFIINVALNSFGGDGSTAESRLKDSGWSQN